MGATRVDQDVSAQVRVGTSIPHPARRYDYRLGGKNHLAADRGLLEPDAPGSARF
jgi:hypothetical protein